MKELAEKMTAARKALGTGTPLKTVTTSAVTVQGMNINSTTTVTSLPRCAASIRYFIRTESVPVRYTVCLIATTLGSSTDCSRKSITGLND